MNAYKVWGSEYYEIVIAESRSKAKMSYASEGGFSEDAFTEGAGLHCRLIEKDVETTNEIEYVKSRYFDLIFAGIIHPDWAEMKMSYGWWWHEYGEEWYDW